LHSDELLVQINVEVVLTVTVLQQVWLNFSDQEKIVTDF